MSILATVSTILKPVAGLISEFITDKDALHKINGELAAAQIGLQGEFIQLEAKALEAKQAIIVAETQSDSWITVNWRPMTMLTFVGLVVAKWLGYTAPGISAAMELELMSLIQIGLGGYVVGRSAEKIVRQLASIIGKKKRSYAPTEGR